MINIRLSQLAYFTPKSVLVFVLTSTLLASCAKEEAIKSAAEMYEEVTLLNKSGDYGNSVNGYADIIASFPYGTYAQQSLLDLAYLHYSESEFDGALSVINRFIREFPGHANIDYARYLRALALHREKPDILDKILFEDYTNHSRASSLEAYQAYQELIQLHPLSRFVPDAIERAESIINSLARIEIKTAVHYLRIGAYSAALRRSSDLIVRYPNSNITEPAMAIIVASLVEMKSTRPLKDATESLEVSFPNSRLVKSATTGSEELLTQLGINSQRGDYFTSLLE